MLSIQPNIQTTGIKPMKPSDQKLIIEYITICANDSVSYFAENLLNTLDISKYSFRSHHIIPLNDNIISVALGKIKQHYVKISKDIVVSLNHTHPYHPNLYSADEITQCLNAKFLRNCMQCIIKIEKRFIKLLSEAVLNRTFHSIDREFEAILTGLCHKSGSMPPINIPNFDISSFKSSAGTKPIEPNSSPEQQSDVSSVCAVFGGETGRDVTPKPIDHINDSSNAVKSNKNGYSDHRYPIKKRIFQSTPQPLNYRQLRAKNQKIDNRLHRQKRIDYQNVNSVIKSSFLPLNMPTTIPPSSPTKPQFSWTLPYRPLHPVIPPRSYTYQPSNPHTMGQYYSRYMRTMRASPMRTIDPNTTESVLTSYIKPKTAKLKYGEARLTDITQKKESKHICDQFMEHTKAARLDVSVLNVYKIRNEKLSDDYKHRRKSIKRGLDNDESKLNEMLLFHGTNLSVIPKIITQGFLRQFTQRHAFGQGCYFAVNAAYSANPRYSTPNREGVQFVFVCSVICGEFCKGNASMKVPDIKPNTDNILYETTCNDVDRPSVFVTFSDNQAIPVYLIAFKNNKLRFS